MKKITEIKRHKEPTTRYATERNVFLPPKALAVLSTKVLDPLNFYTSYANK